VRASTRQHHAAGGRNAAAAVRAGAKSRANVPGRFHVRARSDRTRVAARASGEPAFELAATGVAAAGAARQPGTDPDGMSAGLQRRRTGVRRPNHRAVFRHRERRFGAYIDAVRQRCDL